jgi:genome maintenance exonuclease 1
MVKGSRLYEVGDEHLPSVTTILDAMSDKSAIIAWQKRIGMEEANRQKKEASGLGTATHKLVENYLLKEESKPKGNLVWQMAEKISKPIITNLHVHMDELWGVECTLFYPGLYAGTSDCVAVYKGEPAILDFKTSKKIKKREWIENYFLQCTAYALAHNKMFDTDIKNCYILMVDRDGNFKEFDLSTDFELYSNKWSETVDKYYELNTSRKELPF